MITKHDDAHFQARFGARLVLEQWAFGKIDAGHGRIETRRIYTIE